MNIRKEIKNYAKASDKAVLLGLFDKYHYSSQWHFVAKLRCERYGPLSYEVHRVWSPTEEGRVLYEHLIKPNAASQALTRERQ